MPIDKRVIELNPRQTFKTHIHYFRQDSVFLNSQYFQHKTARNIYF